MTWWYPGSATAHFLLRCGSVLNAAGEGGAEHEGGEAEGGGAEGEAAVVAAKLAVRAVHTLLR